MIRYENEFMYSLLEMNEEINTEIQTKIISENVCIHNKDIELLVEADVDFKNKMKKIFRILQDKITEIFTRFQNTAKELLDIDAKWLKENKEELQKKIDILPSDFVIEMHPYWDGEPYFNNFDVTMQNTFPQFSNEDSTLMNSLETKESFRTKYFSKYLSDKNNPDALITDLRIKFMGSDALVKIKASDIIRHFSSIIKYCETYWNNVNNLKVQLNKIVQDIKKIDSLINKETNVSEMYLFSENCLLSESYILNTLILEAGEDKKENNKNDSNREDDTDNDKLDDKKDENREDEKKNASSDKKQSGIDMQNIKKYRLYISEKYNILSAKMTVSEEKYRDYMKLLRLILNNKKS